MSSQGRTFLPFRGCHALLFEPHRYHGEKVLLDLEGGRPEHIGYVKECRCDAPGKQQFAAFDQEASSLPIAASTFEEAARKLASRHVEEHNYHQSR